MIPRPRLLGVHLIGTRIAMEGSRLVPLIPTVTTVLREDPRVIATLVLATTVTMAVSDAGPGLALICTL
jgi:hypothetical protein